MTTYEYATLLWKSTTKTELSPRGILGQTWDSYYELRVPGEQAVERRDTALFSLLNELGAQGWRLVDSSVLSTAEMEEQGWRPAITPVRQRWVFIRER